MSLFRFCLVFFFVLTVSRTDAQEINWMTWEEAVEACEQAPKKIFVDVYTSWCGWCKKMDSTTFQDSAVVARLNADFYAVKLDAEQKESIFWNDKEYKWMPHKRDGINKLAYDLLNGQLSYPTYVYLDTGFSRRLVSPGYKPPADLLKEIRFIAEDHFLKTTWQQYRAGS